VSSSGVRLLLLADTHHPKRAKVLPDEVWAAVETADLVVHAGDWISVALLEELEDRSRALLGCYGNNDPAPLRERLPLVGRREVEGLRLAVVHETGAAGGRERRMAEQFPDDDVLVFGHSHIPWDTTVPNRRGTLRLLNPGSPTDRRRMPTCTYQTAVVRDGALQDVTLVHLPPRTAGTPADRPAL
jgi:putative phosphoesterase